MVRTVLRCRVVFACCRLLGSHSFCVSDLHHSMFACINYQLCDFSTKCTYSILNLILSFVLFFLSVQSERVVGWGVRVGERLIIFGVFQRALDTSPELQSVTRSSTSFVLHNQDIVHSPLMHPQLRELYSLCLSVLVLYGALSLL